MPPVQNSGEPCADSLSCYRIMAQDLSRLRGEVVTGLFLLVLCAAAAVMLLAGG